jgi:hypothetical protein
MGDWRNGATICTKFMTTCHTLSKVDEMLQPTWRDEGVFENEGQERKP